MLERFKGEDGRMLAIGALKDQRAISNDTDLADMIFEHSVLREFSPGSTIIEDSAPDNDFFFILSGEASVRVGWA